MSGLVCGVFSLCCFLPWLCSVVSFVFLISVFFCRVVPSFRFVPWFFAGLSFFCRRVVLFCCAVVSFRAVVCVLSCCADLRLCCAVVPCRHGCRAFLLFRRAVLCCCFVSVFCPCGGCVVVWLFVVVGVVGGVLAGLLARWFGVR